MVESSCMQHGIHTVQDILIQNRFMTIQELHDTYGPHVAWMDYYTILTAIPTDWKVQLQINPQENYFLYNHKDLFNTANRTQILYTRLISDYHCVEKYALWWEVILQCEVDYHEFLKFF